MAFPKRKTKKLLALCLLGCMLFSAAACNFAGLGNGSSTASSGVTESGGSYSSSAKVDSGTDADGLRVTAFDGAVSLADESVTAWLNGNVDVLISEAVSASVSDRGKPVSLGYDKDSVDGIVESAYVKVAKRGEDLALAEKVKITDKTKNAVDIYNLCPATEYVFSVTVKLKDGGEETKEGSFTTADGVRFIYAANTINVREIGGWSTEDGKRIKRGMLFRGGELDGKHESSFKLNAKGKKLLLNDLGIRFDMDLREPKGDTTAYNVNGLGESVPRTYYDLVYYQSATTTDKGLEKLKAIFGQLAKAETYPVYIHCT